MQDFFHQQHVGFFVPELSPCEDWSLHLLNKAYCSSCRRYGSWDRLNLCLYLGACVFLDLNILWDHFTLNWLIAYDSEIYAISSPIKRCFFMRDLAFFRRVLAWSHGQNQRHGWCLQLVLSIHGTFGSFSHGIPGRVVRGSGYLLAESPGVQRDLWDHIMRWFKKVHFHDEKHAICSFSKTTFPICIYM